LAGLPAEATIYGCEGGCKYKIINLFSKSIFIEFSVLFEFHL
jgi:hypothetical protein